MTAPITLSGVHRRFRTKAETIAAVVDVSLPLEPGTVTALIGPSGSGKTTLLNLVVGWEQPDEGLVTRRADVGSDWDSIAVIPQGIGLLPELTVAENIELPARLGNTAASSIDSLLDELDIVAIADRPPAAISLGEQQRTAVARALATAPLVLVADEPTSHLDEANTQRVVDALRRTARGGTAVLIATHDENVLSAADATFEMHDGRITRLPSH